MIQVRTFSAYSEHDRVAIERAEQNANTFLVTLDAARIRSVTAQTYDTVYPPHDGADSLCFTTHVITVVYDAQPEKQPAPRTSVYDAPSSGAISGVQAGGGR